MTEHGTLKSSDTVIAAIKQDSEQLEADLYRFLHLELECQEIPTLVPDDSLSVLMGDALAVSMRGPLQEALESKVGQEALQLPNQGAGTSMPARPSMVYWMSRNYCGFDSSYDDPRMVTLRRVAVAIRLLLKAAVVIDDIEDGSVIRYGEPALHITQGTSLALNSSCWMIVSALRHVEADNVARQLTESIRDGFTGQALDMSTGSPSVRSSLLRASVPERIAFWETIATLKTSVLFQAPISAAAIALDIPVDEQRQLAIAMRTLGLASQLFNDVSNFVPEFGRDNTHEDFDSLKNRVCLQLLESCYPTNQSPEELKAYVLAHPALPSTLLELADEAVRLKEQATRQVRALCRSPQSASYFDMTIDRKGRVINRLRDTLQRTGLPHV